MNRKRVLRIPLIVVLFLALGALWTALQGGPKSRELCRCAVSAEPVRL